MDYAATLRFLYSQLPMYQRIGKAAYKENLDNTIALCKMLGNPEKKIKAIHIAGTNGKGSAAHMLASILQEAGLKTGLYTSPHLKDFRERIKINGKDISREYVVNFVDKYREGFQKIKPSFFEMTVGLAFDYFLSENTDIAVVEVGMGGRLDSTNVLKPLLSVITNIDYDHKAFLGDTLEKIAAEKAGIIKEKIPVVIGQTQQNIKDVFINKADRCEAPLFFADDCYVVSDVEEAFNSPKLRKVKVLHTDVGHHLLLELPLTGNYQKKNLVTALKAVDILKENGMSITNSDISNGIKNVVVNTGLKGRWHILAEKPLTICDTAHNEAGVNEVLKQLEEQHAAHWHIVLGMVNDKDTDRLLKLFPKHANYYFCKPDIPRGLSAAALKEKAANYGLCGHTYSTVEEAYANARAEATADDLIFIGGSTFVVAEVI